jgi:hypothetical protein
VEKKLVFQRGRAFHHFLQCGKTFCGQLAFLCNKDSVEFLEQAEKDIPKFKSTGEDEPDSGVDHPELASIKLQSLRKRAAELEPPVDHKDIFDHVRELLIEIQETIDEADNAEEGIHQVAEMKAEISAAVASQTLPGEDEAAGTTIGFGTAAASASTAAAQPITVMAVKRKKRPADDAKNAPRAKRPNPNVSNE